MPSKYQQAINQYNRDTLDDAVFAAIRQYMGAHGYAPTIRELCDLVGNNSTSQIARSLERLCNTGQIERAERRARAIRVIGGDA